MPPEFSSRITTAPDVMIRIIGDEAVILNLKSELYLGLDPIGTRFWTAAPRRSVHTGRVRIIARRVRCSARSSSQ